MLKWLIAPSLIISLALFVISFAWDSSPWGQNLTLNLGTTFLGIPLTVLFVDALINRHEARRWAEVRGRVDQRLEWIANVAISSYRVALEWDRPDLGTNWEVMGDPRRRRQAMIDLAQDMLLYDLEDLGRISRDRWDTLFTSLENVYLEADRLLDVFGARMEPNTQLLLIKLQESLNSVGSTYAIFADILGASDGTLHSPRPSDTSKDEIRRNAVGLAQREGRAVLEAAIVIENALITRQSDTPRAAAAE